MKPAMLFIEKNICSPPGGWIDTQIRPSDDLHHVRHTPSCVEVLFKSGEKRLVKPGEVFQVGLILSEPNGNLFASPKDLVHDCNLGRPFLRFSLIDANCIDPDMTSISNCKQLLQALPQIQPHIHSSYMVLTP
ncbi:hypothetical protein GJ744_010928 [Endocarpon pusillum]|uniref:Uncharacterized protein n=1 Tax=Endocarpon pusillum TaxID=364733 RepID=A0A8H7E3A4_9EURO|nr:hypothetical protein GJ744_010928 [Endocarpon pusillum]